jgi:spore maturation protein CgeB
VFCGLEYGLQAHGVTVIPYRLDTRLAWSVHALQTYHDAVYPDAPDPNGADQVYHAGVGLLEMALRESVDVVLVVSGMYLHPDVVVLLTRAGVRVVVLFTETPYDLEPELRLAARVDGGWTHERSALAAFRRVNLSTGYLPHAWHPVTHTAAVDPAADAAAVPAHDVVFVGSGFPERVSWFASVDWTGIDLGLYGFWSITDLPEALTPYVHHGAVLNAGAAALYRRAKVGLNLYRAAPGAESLNPRAYELAACGAFHLSDRRAEVGEIFGDLVPTFDTPAEAEQLIRRYLADDVGRAAMRTALPACVADASWVDRAATVIGDCQRLVGRARAA